MSRQASNRLDVLRTHLTPPDECTQKTEGSLASLYHTLLGTVQESAVHAGFMIADVLKAHGVKQVFCLAGGHISPILVAAEARDIAVIDVRHEASSVFAADAVARLTGIPGVAAVTAGPGVTNTITAVKNAQMAQSPVVLLGGAAATLTKGRGALQDIDQRSVLESVVKQCFCPTTLREVVPFLRQAFQVAMSGTPGPVFVELPMDILYSYLDSASMLGFYDRKKKGDLVKGDKKRVVVPAESKKLKTKDYLGQMSDDAPVFLQPKNPPPFLFGQVMNMKLRYVFANGSNYGDVSPLPVALSMPRDHLVARAALLLQEAKRPVLLVGSQATLNASQIGAIRQAAESLGIPTYLGGMARGLLGRRGPTHVRQNRGKALKKADLVIMAGIIPDFRLSYGRSLPGPPAKIITVNRCENDLKLNSGYFGTWNPTMACLADPGSFLIDLARRVTYRNEAHGAWLSMLKEEDKKVESLNEAKAQEPAFGRGALKGHRLVNPLALLRAVEEVMSDNAIMVVDGGDFVATASYVLRPRAPLGWLDPGPYGTLGIGGGMALGAKAVRPDSEVWLIWGDGAAGFSLAEIDTMARHGLPVIAIIGNDASWQQIAREQLPMVGSTVSCDLDYCKYEAVSQGYGGEGFAITDPDCNYVEVLQRAQQTARTTKKPVVVNVAIGLTKFREGSISV